ncbi:MAG TPA: DUF1572 family protein [Candidatus Angelobacter sp.]|nr:DUF1572 family protein [Candidatus Angelobacter sp.]
MAADTSIASSFLDEAFRTLRGYKRMADGALSQLNDREFFHLLDPESNSVAVVVKHIAGNLRSRWTDFLVSDGEKPDRNRDQEFMVAPGETRESLMQYWERSWETTFKSLQDLKPEDVSRTVYIREEPHMVLQAVSRSVAHMAHHVGQIVFLAKHLRSTEWKTLSIPRGKSAEYNAQKPEDRKVRAPARS